MNSMIVLTDGLEILKTEMSPIMECFWQDYCLLLFIPRFEGQKQSTRRFLLSILRLEIWMNMVPNDE
jgi:hypothetical protein